MMRFLRFGCATLMLASLASVAQADDETEKPDDQPAASERDGRPDREAMRARMMERFDADKDGKLSDEEREKMREFRREQFGERGGRGPREGRGSEARRPDGRERGGPDGRGAGGPAEGRRGEGRRGEGREPEGRSGGRGPEGRGPDGPGPGFRPVGPPAAALFREFDANNDKQLSLEEFEKLMGRLRERMQGPPRGFRGPGGPGGPDARPEGRPSRGEGEGRPERRQRPPRDGRRGTSASEDDRAAAPAANDAEKKTA